MVYKALIHPTTNIITGDWALPGNPRRLAGEARRKNTAEVHRVWQAVRRYKLGVGWKREAVWGKYRVDLVVPVIGLVVEVDGDHDLEDDATRDATLATNGHTIIRFHNDHVNHALDLVVDDIERQVARLCTNRNVTRTGAWRLHNCRRKARLRRR